MFKRFFLQRHLDKLTAMMGKHQYDSDEHAALAAEWQIVWKQLRNPHTDLIAEAEDAINVNKYTQGLLNDLCKTIGIPSDRHGNIVQNIIERDVRLIEYTAAIADHITVNAQVIRNAFKEQLK